MHAAADNLDYLAARVHGRRSRMAEAERLAALCRRDTLAELAQAAFPGAELQSASAFQRHAVQDFVRELVWLRHAASGAGAALIHWILARFQVENLKVCLRACLARRSLRDLEEHLVELPTDLGLDVPALAEAESPAAFVCLLRRGVLRHALERMLVQALGSQPLFFLEAALDRGYLGELLSRATRLPREDLESVIALVQQEADIFHLMLVARGRFHDHLDPPRLLAQHVAGTRLPRARLAAMLNDSSLSAAMRRAVGRALDIAVPDQAGDEVELAAHIETLAWNRYRRLANRAFRCGHLGWGAIVGYVGLRRIETANFMTLSEGVRQGVEPDTLHARMIPRVREEVDHV